MSQYAVGTIAVTNGSPNIVGTSTLWTGNVVAGGWITITNSNLSYQIQSVDSNTTITLTANYNGATASGQTYVIFQDFTSVYQLPLINANDLQTGTMYSRAMNIIEKTLSVATSGVTTLAGCTDVLISTPINNQILTYDGTNSKWINGAIAVTDLNSLSDVVITTPSTNQGLIYNGTNWVNQQINHTTLSNIGTNTHAQLDTHVADTSIHFTKSSIVFDDLSDVVLTSPTNTQVLQFNGTNWINVNSNTIGVLDHTQLSNIGTNTHAQIDTHITNYNSHVADSTIHFTKSSITFNDLSDVVLTSPVNTEVLQFNGTNWVNVPSSNVGVTNFLGLTDTPSAYTSQALKFVRVNSGETALEFTTGVAGNDPQINAYPRTPVTTPSVSATAGTLAIGDAAQSLSQGVSIGYQTYADVGCVAIGYQANANTTSTGNAVAIGYGSIATGPQTIGIGNNAQATGDQSISIGVTSSASGVDSISIGDTATTTQQGSISLGKATNSNKENAIAFKGSGTVRGSLYIQLLGQLTSNATPTELITRNSGSYLNITTNSVIQVKIYVIATASPTYNQHASYEFDIFARNAAGTSSIIGTATKTVKHEDVAAWDCDVAVSDAGDRITITATGEAGKSIIWEATAIITEIIYS